MSINVRCYESLTDIRRSLKKLSGLIRANVKVFEQHKAAANLATTLLATGNTSNAQSRVEIKARDLIDVNKRQVAVKNLNSYYKLLTHLQAIANNELPDDFLVQKLRNEIVQHKATIEKVQASALNDTLAKKLPPDFRAKLDKILAWLKTNLEQSYDMLTSRVLLTANADSIYFNGYIRLSDLVDKTGFSYKDYYIILHYNTAGALAVGIAHSFKTPDEIEYQPTKAPIAVIKRHLALNNIL